MASVELGYLGALGLASRFMLISAEWGARSQKGRRVIGSTPAPSDGGLETRYARVVKLDVGQQRGWCVRG